MVAKRTAYTSVIQSVAKTFPLDPDLVEAVVIQESGGNTHAYRFEPKFWSRYLSKLPAYKDAIPTRVAASYGLMQIMYTVAVECGFHGAPEELFIPLIGLTWGCMKISQLMKWADTFTGTTPDQKLLAVLASYNGGRADNQPDHPSPLRNETYARAVLGIYNSLRTVV